MVLYGSLFVKYLLIYLYFYLVGRGTVLIVNSIFFKLKKIPQYLLFTKSSIIFPALGMAVVGNVLIVLNYFFSLNSLVVTSILILLLSSNFLKLQKN